MRDPSSLDVSTIDPTIELNSCCEEDNPALRKVPPDSLRVWNYAAG